MDFTKKPKFIHEYNQEMDWVNKNDRIIRNFSYFRKSYKY